MHCGMYPREVDSRGNGVGCGGVLQGLPPPHPPPPPPPLPTLAGASTVIPSPPAQWGNKKKASLTFCGLC